MSLESQIAELQRQQQELRRQEAERKRREQQAKEELFEKTEGVHVGCSDDYATLTVGRYGPVYDYRLGPPLFEFYYGYEHTVCPVHADPSECEDCDESEWAFIVKERGTETLRLGMSALAPDASEPSDYLLSGIGMWLARKAAAEPQTNGGSE